MHTRRILGLTCITLVWSLVGCFPEQRRPLGDVCEETAQCVTGECLGGLCLEPESDEDEDGLINRLEDALGTNPKSADTDGDGLADADEVGVDVANPPDEDADGVLDAAESNTADGDDDCLPDHLDAANAVPETDAAARGAKLCAREGVCAAGGATATCEGGESSCDFSAVAGYEPDELSCDGRDNDCDGATDERFAAGGAVSLSGALASEDDGKALGATCGAGACAGGAVICDPEDTARLVCSSDADASSPACEADADCDGAPDAGADLDGCQTFHLDGDGDGHGSPDSRCLCAPDGPFTAAAGDDCDDGNDRTFPESTSIGCGYDADCDGHPLDLAEVCDDADSDRFNGCDACEAGALILPAPENGLQLRGITGLPGGGWVTLWTGSIVAPGAQIERPAAAAQFFDRGGQPFGGRGWNPGLNTSLAGRLMFPDRVVILEMAYQFTEVSSSVSLLRTDIDLEGNLIGEPQVPFNPFPDGILTSFSLSGDQVRLPGGGLLVPGYASYTSRACPDGQCSGGFWAQFAADGTLRGVRFGLPEGVDTYGVRYAAALDDGSFPVLAAGPWDQTSGTPWTIRIFKNAYDVGDMSFRYPCPETGKCQMGTIATVRGQIVVGMAIWVEVAGGISYSFNEVRRFRPDGSPLGGPIYPDGPPAPPTSPDAVNYARNIEFEVSGDSVVWLLSPGVGPGRSAAVTPKFDGVVDPGAVRAAVVTAVDGLTFARVEGLAQSYGHFCTGLLAGELLCGAGIYLTQTTPEGSQVSNFDHFFWRFAAADGRIPVMDPRASRR